MYYDYHRRILQRINNGELVAILPSTKEEFAFVFVFSTLPVTRPVRWRAVWRYEELLQREKGKEKWIENVLQNSLLLY